MMARRITINLEAADVFQMIDALENRAEAYERTAALLISENNSGQINEDDSEMASEEGFLNEFFLPEEVRDASEAEEIAKHFRDIIATLENQVRKTA
jgi:hypothetical protein